MGVILRRRTLPFKVAGAATGGLVIRSAGAQPSSPAATPIPVAALGETTADGIDVPVLGIAFGGGEIVATPKVTAGTVRMLTAVPYEDFGRVIFRIPDDQPDAIEQIWAGFAQPGPVLPDWIWETYFPGGVRTDHRYGTTAEGFVHRSHAAHCTDSWDAQSPPHFFMCMIVSFAVS